MQKLFKISIILLSLISFSTFAQESKGNEKIQYLRQEKSHYVSGTVVDINTDENGFKNYITKLKDGSTIDVNTYGVEVPIGSKIHLEYFPGQDNYNFVNINRNFSLALITLLFIASILILARKKRNEISC